MRLVAGIRQYRLGSGHTLFDVFARLHTTRLRPAIHSIVAVELGAPGLEPTDDIRGHQSASERIVLEQ